MPWPLPQDYNEAIQNPSTSFGDSELRACRPVVNTLGLPLPRSGSFADVYELYRGERRWAVKCFTRPVPGLRERYSAASRHLSETRLPFFVDFHYVDEGISVRGNWFPIVQMDWIEGLLLNEFVRENADRPAALDALLEVWGRLAARLREAQVAHGDLQHGNVLLVPGSTPRALALRLVDYDGIWVPALAQRISGEAGHPAFQHPERRVKEIYGPEMDRFPLLVIATALRCVSVAGSRLWRRYDNGDNLLFRESDLRAPRESDLFQELWRLDDAAARALLGNLLLATREPPTQTPTLGEILADGTATSLTPAQERRVASILGIASTARPQATPSFVGALADPVLVGSVRSSVIPAAEPVAKAWVEPPPEQSSPREHDVTYPQDELTPRQVHARIVWRRHLVHWAIGAALLAVGLLGVTLIVVSLRRLAPVVQASHDLHKSRETKSVTSSITEPTPVKSEEAAPSPTQQPEIAPVRPPRIAAAEPPPVPRSDSETTTVEQLRTFVDHTEAVWCVAFSPDGRHFASGSSDRTIRVWDMMTGLCTLTLTGHGDAVWSLAYSPDGQAILSGSKDRTVRWWNVRTGLQVRVFSGHSDMVDAVAFSQNPRLAFSASRDGTCRIWNSLTAKEVARCGKGRIIGYALAVSPSGDRVLYSSGNNEVCVWDTPSRRDILRMPGHGAHVYSLAFSPEGESALSAGGDGTIRLWDLTRGEIRRVLTGHSKPVLSAVFSPRGQRILSASDDRTVRLWDANTGQEIHRFSGHTAEVRGVAFSPDGRYAISGAIDKTVRLWRLPSYEASRDGP
jgi:hypothetical protein